MPFELFLALRYLRSRRRRRLTRVTALVAILGITIGLAAFIVALALAKGFRDEIQSKILRGTSHLNIMRADGQSIREYSDLAKRIEAIKGVASATGTTYTGAVVTGTKGSAYAVLRGIDSEAVGVISEVQTQIKEGSVDPLFEPSDNNGRTSLPAVLVGAELANRTGIRVGERIEVIAASSDQNFFNPVRRLVRVAGTFQSGLFEYDSTWIYMTLDAAAGFSGPSQSASMISVQVHDIYRVKETNQSVLAVLGSSYTAVDWQEANQPLFSALELERRMALFVIGIIIVIAALNIATTLILVVVERRRDIAILSAMGADNRSIMAVFLIDGAIIGLVGALGGILLGRLICLVGNHYQLVSLPGDVYSISNVPFNSTMRDTLLAATVALGISLLATIYPARAAARMRPVAILRDAQ